MKPWKISITLTSIPDSSSRALNVEANACAWIIQSDGLLKAEGGSIDLICDNCDNSITLYAN